MNAQAKTINLLLYDGNLSGVISIEDSNWNSGELYSAPRESVSDLLETEACKKYGVYLLLSPNMVYIGQSSDLAKRITQHTVGKDWWESVVILTTKDDSLNHSDIDYLESVLIEKAQKVNRLDCDNKNKGNPPKVDKFRKVYLGQYLDEALFIMQLIGINVFAENGQPKKIKEKKTLSQVNIDVKSKLSLGKRVKAEAIQFVQSQGVEIYPNTSYAVKQANKDSYWLNPNKDLLGKDWTIILNDNKQMILTVISIKANELHLYNGMSGIKTRKDRPDMLDMSIDIATHVEKVSKTSLQPYIVKQIKY